MAYFLKDGDKNFIGCFGETLENQFSFLATNFEEFFVEKLSSKTFSTRCEESNESFRLKDSKMIKTLKEEAPEACKISQDNETLKFDLKFIVNNRPLNFYFRSSKCDSSEIGSLFATGLMKLAMENTSMIGKLKKAVEAKDLEIEEYKRNGGTLIRESLATKKFDFEEETKLSTVNFNQNHFTFNPSPLLKESNIPQLCTIIRAENMVDNTKEGKAKHYKEPPKIRTQAKSKSSNRYPVQKAEKKFEYEDENLSQELDLEDVEDSQSRKTKSHTVVPTSSKNPRLAKKTFQL